MHACRRIPVVQAFFGSKYIGLLKLSWTKAAGLQVEDGSGPVLLGSTSSSNPVAQDPAVAAVIAPLKPAVDALQTQVGTPTTV
jgi:2',3'-cyclic-nucleotide 2'-phosphodiesterase (5'-nucleotidase family)